MIERLRNNAFSQRDYGLIVPFSSVVVYVACMGIAQREWDVLPGMVLIFSSPLLPAVFYSRYAAAVAACFYCSLVISELVEMQFEHHGSHLFVVAALAVYGWTTAAIVFRYIRDRRRRVAAKVLSAPP